MKGIFGKCFTINAQTILGPYFVTFITALGSPMVFQDLGGVCAFHFIPLRRDGRNRHHTNGRCDK